jgi:amidase
MTMSDLELCYLPATEALQRFRSKTLSPVELLDAMLQRIEETEPVINALTFKHFDEARDRAKKAESKYAVGKRTGALEGLPVGIKDENYIKGKPTSNGSLINKDFVADTTSVNNQRILRAGALVHARTARPEFSCAGYTNSRL